MYPPGGLCPVYPTACAGVVGKQEALRRPSASIDIRLSCTCSSTCSGCVSWMCQSVTASACRRGKYDSRCLPWASDRVLYAVVTCCVVAQFIRSAVHQAKVFFSFTPAASFFAQHGLPDLRSISPRHPASRACLMAPKICCTGVSTLYATGLCYTRVSCRNRLHA